MFALHITGYSIYGASGYVNAIIISAANYSVTDSEWSRMALTDGYEHVSPLWGRQQRVAVICSADAAHEISEEVHRKVVRLTFWCCLSCYSPLR